MKVLLYYPNTSTGGFSMGLASRSRLWTIIAAVLIVLGGAYTGYELRRGQSSDVTVRTAASQEEWAAAERRAAERARQEAEAKRQPVGAPGPRTDEERVSRETEARRSTDAETARRKAYEDDLARREAEAKRLADLTRPGSATQEERARQEAEAARRQAEEEARRKAASSALLPPAPQFPWPPPRASAWYVVPNELILQSNQPAPTLDVISGRLERALDAAAYYQRSFFEIPNGFALVTQLERIKTDGTSETSRRWIVGATAAAPFSLEEYVRRLLYADPGRYRLVVFAVTNVPFSMAEAGPGMTAGEASRLAERGANVMPPGAASRAYSSAHRCTAIIYEFRKTGDSNAELVLPSAMAARDHLVKGQVWAALENALRQK